MITHHARPFFLPILIVTALLVTGCDENVSGPEAAESSTESSVESSAVTKKPPKSNDNQQQEELLGEWIVTFEDDGFTTQWQFQTPDDWLSGSGWQYFLVGSWSGTYPDYVIEDDGFFTYDTCDITLSNQDEGSGECTGTNDDGSTFSRPISLVRNSN